MQKYKLYAIGTGFLWIFFWSLFGSILGAHLEQIAITSADKTWVTDWQNILLKTTHAHMNMMGITTILLGVTLPYIRGFCSDRNIIKIICINVISIPVFGFGMILESFSFAGNGNSSLAIAITALGGVIYMLTIAIWGILFISCAIRKNK